MVQFDRPGLLLLIPAALGLLVLARRRALTSWSPRQALGCLSIRFAIAALVSIALAGPRLVGSTRDAAVIFLEDVSPSMEGQSERADVFREALRRDTARSAEAVFDATPRIVRPFGQSPLPPPQTGKPEPSTDLNAALEFAAAALPADRPGRVVLFSDGIRTDGPDPAGAVARLAGRGIELDVVPVSPPPRPDAAVTGITMPSSIRENEFFDLTATVHSALPAPGAEIRLYQNQLLAAELRHDLAAGPNRIVFPNVRAEGRLATYEVEVLAADDTRPENDRRKAAAAHSGPAGVLIVDATPDASKPLASALETGGFRVQVRPPSGFPSTMEDLQAFDLVVFSDAPAREFSDAQFKLVKDWVQDFGGGFLMLGGEESFGAGGYFHTPIATMLPVRIEREDRDETPVVALLVILDRSGSMTALVDGQTKMALANEGAALAMEVLQGKDLFGVFAVDTRVQDVVPLGHVHDKAAAARQIAGISSGGGGIYVYTSLAEALPRLRNADAKIKHIILFADAADAEEKTAGSSGGAPGRSGSSALDLAAALLANRITLSVVALGSEQDQDTTFLRQLAAQGGGRFYLTADATTLPRLFTLETMRATESSLREDAFLAVPKGDPETLRGMDWNAAPFLLGFNVSRLKPGADLLLSTEKGDPLFATWQFGLGRVAAFTSDAKARWASEWLAWPGYGKFWIQAARSLLPPASRDDLSVSVREDSGQLVVEAQAVDSHGAFRNSLSVTASMAAAGQDPKNAPLRQVGPGTYRATFRKPAASPVLIALSDGGAKPVSVTWTPTYPAEFLPPPAQGPDWASLSASTDGQIDPPPEALLRPAAHPARTLRDLAPWCLLLATLLWPLDVWLRRRLWKMNGEKSLPSFSPAR